jgi:hypothetical protein
LAASANHSISKAGRASRSYRKGWPRQPKLIPKVDRVSESFYLEGWPRQPKLIAKVGRVNESFFLEGWPRQPNLSKRRLAASAEAF